MARSSQTGPLFRRGKVSGAASRIPWFQGQGLSPIRAHGTLMLSASAGWHSWNSATGMCRLREGVVLVVGCVAVVEVVVPRDRNPCIVCTYIHTYIHTIRNNIMAKNRAVLVMLSAPLGHHYYTHSRVSRSSFSLSALPRRLLSPPLLPFH